MNDNQKLFVVLAVVGALALCLVPPWQGRPDPGSSYAYAGHRLIFYTGPSVMVTDNASYHKFAETTRFGKRLHLQRLALELTAIAAAAVLVTLARTKKVR